MKQLLISVGITAMLLSVPLEATAATFSKLYVFGDSLSDTGNVFNVTGIPPSPPYAPGRFSNGPIWVDVLAADLGLNPAPLVSPPGTDFSEGINFAFGGATTGLSNTVSEDLLGLQEQVFAFGSFFPMGNPDPDALYVVWAGGNDYLPTTSSTFAPFITPDPTIANITQALNGLYSLGARNFLVANLSDIGGLPQVVNTPLAPFLSQLTIAHNTQLEATLMTLNQTLPGANFNLLDVNILFQEVIAENQFGVVDEACVDFTQLQICSQPDEYLFWDILHPTTVAHAQIGTLAINTLDNDDPTDNPAAVPEPATVVGLMAIAALGAGAKGRSRQR